jgi:hypothetical protein
MRLVFAAVMFAALGSATSARADAYADCAQVQPADARLACFDKAASAAKASSTPASTEAPPPVSSPSTAETPQPAPAPAPAPTPAPKKKGGALFGLFGGSKEQPAGAGASPPPPASTPSTTSAPSQQQPSAGPDDVGKFGMPEKKDPAKDQGLKKITAKIVSFELIGFNQHIVVHLDNGQVWRQISSDYAKFPLSKGKTYIATISRGFFGSYDLEIEGFRQMAKVERIQ